MPKAVEECVKSVLADNPEYSESRAYAICNAMRQRNELEVSDNPSHDELLTAAAQQEIDCPEGHVHTGSQCVPIEEVRDVPPSLLSEPSELEDDPCWEGYTMVGTKIQDGEEVPRCVPDDDVPDANMAMADESECPDGKVKVDGDCVSVDEIPSMSMNTLSEPSVFQLADLDTQPIERVEAGENTVRYENIKLLSPGVWTDSASREQIWYSPEGIKNLEIAPDNVVNIMHDADNSVSAAGEIDPKSVQADSDGIYADVVLDTSKTAGEYADENLQKTLETEGAKGFGGPSVEIAAEGQQIEFNADKGMKELVGGVIDGLGLVKNPASKPVSFARQTAQRGVALSDGQETMFLEEERALMDPEEAREILEKFGFDTGDMDDEDVVDMLKDMGEEIADYMDMPEEGEGEDMENADGEEEEEMPEEEEEDDDMDMADKIQSLEERLTNLEDMAEQAMMQSDVEEELSAAREELADAETVAELEEAKEALDKRLSEIEDQPNKPKALADGDTETDEKANGNTRMVAERDSFDGTIRR